MTKNNQETEIQHLLDQQEQIIEQRIQQRLRELPPTREAELKQAHQQLTFHVENSPLAVIEWDEQFRVKRWSPQAEKIFGWKQEELLNRHWNQWEFVHPEDLEQVKAISSRLLNGEENRNICCNRNYTKHGNLVYCEWYNSVLKNANGQVISLLSLVQNITIRETAQQELKRRARQQQVIAELGQYALSQTNLDALLKRVVTLVGQILGSKYVQIWELLPNQSTFLLTAGLGWRPRSVGRATLNNSPQSQPGYTLLLKEPVIVEDLRVETRFSSSEFFSNHHIVSGVTVLISGKEKPFGVLGIHSQEQRTFSPDEINFLQAIANIIASGVERQQAEAELKTLNQDLEIRVADRTTELIFMNEKLQRQVIELKKIESELENKAAQQAIIAELGQKALSETNLVSLINQVVIQIANNLNIEYCKVLEYSLEDCFLTLAIWDEPLKNYILLSHEPLLSISLNRNQLPGNQEDLKSSFVSGSCKYSHNLQPTELNYGKFNFVNQGICIPIQGQNYQQLGQIEIYGKKNQLFSEDDVNYLQSVANILATAIERKQTEAALRFSEERFKITLKNSPIVVFNQDLELRYTWIYNPAGGYETEAVIGKLDLDLFPRENAIQLTQLKQQVLNTKVGLRKEVTTNLGEDFQCYDLTIDPLWDLEGNIIGITGAALDITDRKKAELELQESQRFIQGITDAIPNILYIYDLIENRNIYVNQEIIKILGYTPEQTLQKGSSFLSELIHPDDYITLAKHYDKFATANEDEIFEFEYRIKDIQGNWHWLVSRDTIFARTSEGKPKQILGAATDITERKKVEEKLRLSERAIAYSSNGIVITDARQPDNPIVFVNPAFEKVTGYSEEEVLGKNSRFLQGKDHNQPELKQIKTALKQKKKCNVVLRNYRKDGSLFWNELNISPIYDQEGNLTHYLGIQNDITENKLAQERLGQQVIRERLITTITQRIRESLDLKSILSTMVTEVKQFLKADRVLVYRIYDDYTGCVISEAVSPEWCSLLEQTFDEEIFPSEYHSYYIKGKIASITNINDGQILPCLVEFLTQFKVQAKLAVPIIENGTLWGLLIAHQCSQPRQWEAWEISLLEQITSQLAMAIQQSELYEQLQTELKERSLAQQSLLVSQERLKYLLFSSPGIIYSSKPGEDYQTTFISDNIKTILGYDVSDFTQPGFWLSHIHPEDIGRITNQLSPLFEQGYCSYEYRFQHRDGTYRWMYDQAKLIPDAQGNPLEIVGYWIDISDRKRIEEQLWATTSRLSTLIENLQLGVLVKDEFDKIVLINQAFCDLFKIKDSSNHLIGMDGKTFSFEYQNLFSDPTQFIIRNQEVTGRKRVITNEELSLVDGRTVERDYVPIMIQGNYQGHLWMYRDITEYKQAEDSLITSLREKEVLLKEIHHRVKNNLLVVSNLLEFQSDMFTEPELIKVLDDSRNRIYSMALIHEKLYRSTNLEKINFGDYLEDLIDNLFESYNIQAGRIEFKLDVEPVGLNIETAQPCGLIVNELISNTLKHAFPNGRSGIVDLGLHQNPEDKIILTVRDNGIGFPAGVDFRNVESLGMELVCTLTEQIEGTITLNQENGTLFTVSFSELQYRHRF
ncbi:MAG: hypothetical protein AUK43_09855 [Oscillatoriales cyanobacterium CG2_30_40_61]|nr:MAG: hypothetical protein AUK43_09855 [Oscillatoriales cyanobacterium CG2_30_40_61]